jgi:DNA-binding XRE family transcriptional regulator
MTVELSRNSPRLPAARRFADELRRSMAAHKVGQRRLGMLTGCASSAVAQWRMGRNLPRLDTAIRLAECLSNDRLTEIVREARTQRCQHCGTPFLNEGGAPKKFCSERCLTIAAKIRGALSDRTPARKKLTVARAELKAAQETLGELQVSVLEMCRSCEPAGYCRTPECPLRLVSPIPLAFGLKDVPLATKAPGAWSAEHREKQLAAIREANALRWAKPGEREAQTELMRTRHQEMSAEQHEEWVQKIRDSKAKRGKPVRPSAFRAGEAVTA